MIRIKENKTRQTKFITSKRCKNSAFVNKQGKSFENILKAVANIGSKTNTMEDSNNSILQGAIILSSDTLKDSFLHLRGKISEFPYLQKLTVVTDIVQMQGKCITEEWAMIVSEE